MAQGGKRDNDISELRRLEREVQRRSAEGDYYDDSDIFGFDRRLAEAEQRRTGATLPLYYEAYRPVLVVGAISLLIGLVVVLLFRNWLLGGLALGLAILLFIGPLAAWSVSRPRVRGTKDDAER